MARAMLRRKGFKQLWKTERRSLMAKKKEKKAEKGKEKKKKTKGKKKK
jgi:hypothetical protein